MKKKANPGRKSPWTNTDSSAIPNSLIPADPTMNTRLMFHAALVALAFSCGLTGTLSARAAGPVRMADVIIEYTADSTNAERFYDLRWSAVRLERLDRLSTDWLARLAALDFDALSQAGKVDYVLLRNRLEQSRASLVRDRRRLAEIDPLIPFRETIYQLEVTRLRGKSIDGQATASTLSELASQVKRLHERVEKGKAAGSNIDKADPPNLPPPKPSSLLRPILGSPCADRRPSRRHGGQQARRAAGRHPGLALRSAEAVAGLRQTLKAWFTFYDGFHPQLSWWLKKPYEDADKQLEAYGVLLQKEIAGQKGKDEDPLVGDPIGPAARGRGNWL